MYYNEMEHTESTRYVDTHRGIDLRTILGIISGVAISVGPLVAKTTAGVLLYGALLLPVGFAKPAWCIYAVFYVCSNYGIALLGPQASWTRIVVPIGVTVLVTSMGISGRIPRPDRAWLYTALLYVYVSTISLVHGRMDFRLLSFMALTLSLRLFVMRDPIRLREVLGAYVYATLTSVAVGIVRMAQQGLAFGVYRFEGGYTDPNEFAKMLLLAVALTVTTDVVSGQVRRGLITMILLTSVFLTQSKMGALVGACFLAFWAMKWLADHANKHGYASSVTKVTVLLCVIGLVGVAVPWRVLPIGAGPIGRFAYSPSTFLGTREKLDFLTTGRWSIYEASVEAFVNAPLKSQLTGAGYNGSRESLAGSLGRLVSTHSVYLQVLLDFGILGALLFLCVLMVLLDWTRVGLLNWFWRNAVIVAYLLTFGALAWLLSWSDIVLFACVGTPSFRCLYSRHVVERG